MYSKGNYNRPTRKGKLTKRNRDEQLLTGPIATIMFEMHLNRTGSKAAIFLDNILPQFCVMIISFQFTKGLCNTQKHFAEEYIYVLTVPC